MQSDRDAYAASSGTWATMRSSATAFQPQLPPLSSAMSSTRSQLNGMNIGTALTAANGITTTYLITDQNTYAVAGQATIAVLLPNLASGGPYDVAVTAMKTAYDALGSPVTQVCVVQFVCIWCEQHGTLRWRMWCVWAVMKYNHADTSSHMHAIGRIVDDAELPSVTCVCGNVHGRHPSMSLKGCIRAFQHPNTTAVPLEP